MGSQSSIQWTSATWAPVRGCSRISPGCENCYAENIATRFSGPGLPYEGFATRSKIRGLPMWTGKVKLVPEHLADPLKWKKPRRIFCTSTSDIFHAGLSNEDIAAVFGIMASAPQHTFQVLTKRAKRMREWFEWVNSRPVDPGCGGGVVHPFGIIADAAARAGVEGVSVRELYAQRGGGPAPWPLSNVWLGVSAEDRPHFLERVAELQRTPAAVRFVSYEPGLDDLGDISPWLSRTTPVIRFEAFTPEAKAAYLVAPTQMVHRGIDWIIVGGESGPRARPFNVAWARSVREQCASAKMSFFMKQMGHRVMGDALGFSVQRYIMKAGRDWVPPIIGKKAQRIPDDAIGFVMHGAGDDMVRWPADLRVREFPT